MKKIITPLINAICEAVEFADQSAGEGMIVNDLDALTIYDNLSQALDFIPDGPGQLSAAVRRALTELKG